MILDCIKDPEAWKYLLIHVETDMPIKGFVWVDDKRNLISVKEDTYAMNTVCSKEGRGTKTYPLEGDIELVKGDLVKEYMKRYPDHDEWLTVKDIVEKEAISEEENSTG